MKNKYFTEYVDNNVYTNRNPFNFHTCKFFLFINGKVLPKIEIVTKSIILNLMSQKYSPCPFLVSNYNKMCRRAERSNEIKMQL